MIVTAKENKYNINRIKFFPLLTLFFFLFVISYAQIENDIVELRSNYTTLSVDEAKEMIIRKNFFDKFWNNTGEFENMFQSEEINKDKIVIDQATDLIWHQSGSKDFLNLPEAKEWISILNTKGYAGHTSWRLPTLEEALTLMEKQKKNKGMYIDRAFDRWQWCILTGDSLDSNKNWLVAFSGRIDWFDANVRINYVRPVCPNIKD